VVVTKVDLLGPDEPPPEIDAPDAWGRFEVSSVSRQGLAPLLEALWAQARDRRLEEEEAAEGAEPW
jgi:hypothetical protein